MTNIAKMTRAEFWEKHDAIKQLNAQGVAIAPSSPLYDRDAYFALHRAYHGQWAQHVGKLPADLLARCKQALEAGDAHMNSPFTALKEWDEMAYLTKGRFAEDHGTWKGWSLSLNTGILKEAARMQIEASKA